MKSHAILPVFLAFTLASGAVADETIVQRLEETGARMRFARAGDADVTKKPMSIAIPHDWEWTDHSVDLVRELLGTLDTELTIYLAGPRVKDHERVDQLKKDFPSLVVKRAPAAFLGVTCIDSAGPCVVTMVIPESAAAAAGIMKGDTIVGINETDVITFKMLQTAMYEFLPDEKVAIHLTRDSKDMTFSVTLGSLPLPPSTRSDTTLAPE